MSSSDLERSHLLEPLAALQRLLDQYPKRGVIIGGIASSLLGKPRLTVDLDAVILLSTDAIPKLLQDARTVGLKPRIENVEEFARRYRVVLLQHESSGTNIDLSLGVLPFEQEMVEQSIIHEVAGLSLPLPTPENLIILKAVAHRSKDLLDIQAIIESHPNLDRTRIEYWMKQFADVLGKPELWEDIAGWF